MGDFIDKWFLTQVISECTRQENILDFFFSSDEFSISNCEIMNNTRLSDHLTNRITFRTTTTTTTTQ